MRQTKKVLLTIGIAILGMIGMQAAPAAAVTAGTATFVVNVQTVPLGVVGLFPPNSGAVTVTSTVACAEANAGKKVTAGLCDIQGSGTITGNCGLSSGWLWGYIRKSNGDLVRYHIHFQTAAGAVVATGTAYWNTQTGPITVEGVATPVPSVGGPSCLTGTQTSFVVVGEATWVTT